MVKSILYAGTEYTFTLQGRMVYAKRMPNQIGLAFQKRGYTVIIK